MKNQIMMFAVFGGMMAFAVAALDVLNLCPQSVEENQDISPSRYAHPDDCRFYLSCARGQPRLRQCKPLNKTRFSEYYHTCAVVNTVFDTCTRANAQRECESGFEGLIGHPTACNRYYNCSQEYIQGNTHLGRYEAVCPYPQLFDLKELRCKHFKEVTCGPDRTVTKNLCDYVDSPCAGPKCQSCAERLPSCEGLEDGLHAVVGNETSKFYMRCDSERLTKKLVCSSRNEYGKPKVFSPVKKMCVTK